MFKILEEAAVLENDGVPVIHLEIGDTSKLLGSDLRSRLIEEDYILDSFGYGPSAGEPELRDYFANVFSSDYNYDFQRENVVVTPANAALTQLLSILTDPGDFVLLPDPCFSTYALAAAFTQVNVEYFLLEEERSFAPSIISIRDKLEANPAIRAVVIDIPSNPLGVAHDTNIIEAISVECQKEASRSFLTRPIRT